METGIKTLAETPTFRLSKLLWQDWGGSTKMYKLELKINGMYIPVQRYTMANYTRSTITAHVKHIDPKRGYFSVYGNSGNWQDETYQHGEG